MLTKIAGDTKLMIFEQGRLWQDPVATKRMAGPFESQGYQTYYQLQRAIYG